MTRILRAFPVTPLEASDTPHQLAVSLPSSFQVTTAPHGSIDTLLPRVDDRAVPPQRRGSARIGRHGDG